jgi:hypothetical protein
MAQVQVNDRDDVAYPDAVSPIRFTLPNNETFRVFDRETLVELAEKCLRLAVDFHEV